jgi:hypothetical protein
MIEVLSIKKLYRNPSQSDSGGLRVQGPPECAADCPAKIAGFHICFYAYEIFYEKV